MDTKLESIISSRNNRLVELFHETGLSIIHPSLSECSLVIRHYFETNRSISQNLVDKYNQIDSDFRSQLQMLLIEWSTHASTNNLIATIRNIIHSSF